MEDNNFKFKIPKKKERLNAIGNIDKLPENSLKTVLETGENFHKPMYSQEEGDWLLYNDEEGQTFNQFLKESKNIISKERNIIYINPLQDMPQEFLDNISLYCQCFFYPMQVKLIKIVSLEELNVKKRIHYKLQYHSGQINSKMIKYIPKDAHCLISILLDDLYPGQSWNYVFGEALYKKRVGVFSFARFSESFFDNNKPFSFDSYLLYNSCSTLTHEICHTFGIMHCIYYTCLMNGCNNLEEAKKQTLYECPVCLRKLQYSIGFDPLERYKKLFEVTKKFGGNFENACEWYEKRINSIN